MAFADQSTYMTVGDGSIIGSFYEKEQGNLFEYSKNPSYVEPVEDVQRFLLSKETDFTKVYPHLVWVLNEGDPMREHMAGFRFAKILKTRAHVVVDEDENGPVIEVWHFKQNSRRTYRRA